MNIFHIFLLRLTLGVHTIFTSLTKCMIYQWWRVRAPIHLFDLHSVRLRLFAAIHICFFPQPLKFRIAGAAIEFCFWKKKRKCRLWAMVSFNHSTYKLARRVCVCVAYTCSIQIYLTCLSLFPRLLILFHWIQWKCIHYLLEHIPHILSMSMELYKAWIILRNARWPYCMAVIVVCIFCGFFMVSSFAVFQYFSEQCFCAVFIVYISCAIRVKFKIFLQLICLFVLGFHFRIVGVFWLSVCACDVSYPNKYTITSK